MNKLNLNMNKLASGPSLVRGIAAGCRQAGCALIGGETAELPGFYAPGEYDLAGFAVGVAERRRLVDGRAVRPGDVVLGLASTGLHSNGFSLVRKLLLERGRLRVTDRVPGLGVLGSVLLTVRTVPVAWPGGELRFGRGDGRR